MPDTLTLREETKRLTALPAPGFAPQTTITVADANLLESAAPNQRRCGGRSAALHRLDGRNTVRLARAQAPGLHPKKACVRLPASQRSGSRRRAWRRASRPSSWQPQGLTSRPSRWRNRPKPTPLAPRPRPLALVRASFMHLARHPFPHFFLCLSRAFERSGGSGGGTRRP
jgi:hypothetical protein